MKIMGEEENTTKKRSEHLHYCGLNMDIHLPPLYSS